MNPLFCLVVVACAFGYTDLEYETHFSTFLRDFDKVYEGDEVAYRFNVFKTNFDAIQEHNRGNYSWTEGVNQFTDLTNLEFSKIYLGYIHRPKEAVASVV